MADLVVETLLLQPLPFVGLVGKPVIVARLRYSVSSDTSRKDPSRPLIKALKAIE